MRKLIEESKSAELAARGSAPLSLLALDNKLRELAIERGYIDPDPVEDEQAEHTTKSWSCGRPARTPPQSVPVPGQDGLTTAT